MVINRRGAPVVTTFVVILSTQAWSIKDLLYGLKNNLSCRIPISPARVNNHSVEFDSFHLLTEQAM